MVKNLFIRTSLNTAIGLASALAADADPGNRYGADRDLGHEVSSIRRDLDSTTTRVNRLEGQVKTIRTGDSSDGQVSYSGAKTPPAPISKHSGAGQYHRVGTGETLSSIARTYQIGVDRLVAENHITNPNALQIGQEIYVPGRKGSTAATPPPTPGKSAPPQGASTAYRIKAGDTLSSIARRFGITSTAIARANGITDPNTLGIGQKLDIPGDGATNYAAAPPRQKPPAPAPAPEPKLGRDDEIIAPDGHGYYQVEKGDTLHSIAISFGTNTRELRRLNDIQGDSLHVGDFLLVPVPDESLYES